MLIFLLYDGRRNNFSKCYSFNQKELCTLGDIYHMANNSSQHILGSSTSLLGFCLVVITSFHLTNKSDSSLIDEFSSGIAMLLIISCFFSFISIREKNPEKNLRSEAVAEYVFLISLIGIMLIIVLLVFRFIR